MSLEQIVDNTRTDKNTTHSYLPLYESLFQNTKETAQNILEIGIQNGGSIKLWRDYFINATIYGLDIIHTDQLPDDIKNDKNIILHTSTNAYDSQFFQETFLNKNLKFDLLVDDGPHTLESMKQFINLYSQVLADDGILIIEDIQCFEWIDILKSVVPDHFKEFIKIYDLRNVKGRYDDIIFTIQKSI
jgi:hypothetical protein